MVSGEEDMKTSNWIIPIALSSMGLSLQGCAPVAVFGAGMELGASAAEERGFGGVISDVALKNTIRYRLMNHDMSLFSNLCVLVHQGRALLTGQAETQQQHKDILKIVKGVGGVKEIIDEVKVKPSIGVTQIAKDSFITTQLNSSLMLDDKINSINYQIKTEDGVVYILGIAQDLAELQKVTNHARSIGGVKQVVSHVKIKGREEGIKKPMSSPHSSHAPLFEPLPESVSEETEKKQTIEDPFIQDSIMDDSLPPPETF
jgi:osmotically-inducible protein OsmY